MDNARTGGGQILVRVEIVYVFRFDQIRVNEIISYFSTGVSSALPHSAQLR